MGQHRHCRVMIDGKRYGAYGGRNRVIYADLLTTPKLFWRTYSGCSVMVTFAFIRRHRAKQYRTLERLVVIKYKDRQPKSMYIVEPDTEKWTLHMFDDRYENLPTISKYHNPNTAAKRLYDLYCGERGAVVKFEVSSSLQWRMKEAIMHGSIQLKYADTEDVQFPESTGVLSFTG